MGEQIILRKNFNNLVLCEKDLENFLKASKVDFELIKFENSVVTSEAASNQTKGTIVKSILLICDNTAVLCLLLGKDRVDLEKIKKEISCKDARLAKAKEVKELTGYDVGALPPFAHVQKIRTIVDNKLAELNENETIYCGGGSHYHLLKIKKADFLKLLNQVEIRDISQ
jgi:prolyl-tRNA editing enzyme YbaK/EbsC (Cys-tRNA(Pro) deacylase)